MDVYSCTISQPPLFFFSFLCTRGPSVSARDGLQREDTDCSIDIHILHHGPPVKVWAVWSEDRTILFIFIKLT